MKDQEAAGGGEIRNVFQEWSEEKQKEVLKQII